MSELIEVSGVTKAFGGIVANDDVSISVPEGHITGLIGPNGSGKTTLFNSIVGYHPIDEGSIKFKGQEISDMLVPEIARGLDRLLARDGFGSVAEAVGTGRKDWL